MANTFYNRSIRKIIVAFGDIFSGITLVRYNLDNTEQERFIIPINYASKERYVMRLEEDPDLNKKVQMGLPKLAFELNGISYDATRKQNTNIKNFASNPAGGVSSQYNPVPYNFDFSVYLLVRNIEDGTQVMEHILPYFTPDYTIKINMIPEMGIIKEIPVVLNSTTYEVDYEGARDSETRKIIWTLNFTAKGYIFGAVNTNTNIIRTSITNIYNDISTSDTIGFNMSGDGFGTYKIGEIVYQGYSINTSTATAKVLNWANGILHLTNIQGNFVSSHPIVGATTKASYNFTSYGTDPLKIANIVVTPTPTDANASSIYSYTTQITETPNVEDNIIFPTNFAGDLSIQVGLDDLNAEQENPIDLN